MASLHQRLAGPSANDLMMAHEDRHFAADEKVRELDCREDSHEKVELLWSAVSTRVYLRITDKQYDIARLYFVPSDKARDAFLHPYCYTA